MAEMIPETLAESLKPTTGERRVFDLLRDCLVPHTDYIVWYEPRSARRLPDFLVWAPRWGLLVIEVKDWRYQTIAEATQNVWTLRLPDGSTKRKLNPLKQARTSLFTFKDLLETAAPLRQASGSLRFPIAHCVLFTRISRPQAQARKSSENLLRTLDKDRCLFRDDLPRNADDPDARAAFVARLEQAFVERFPFPPLPAHALEIMRSLLFPEVRLPPPRNALSGPLRTPEQDDLVQTLDLRQERIAKQISSDHHVLKGVAGSGKSLVLACRAKFLQTQHPEWRILVVCFNRSLCQYLRQLSKLPETVSPDVFHFHGLVKHLTGLSTAKTEAESQDVYDDRIGDLLQTGIENGSILQRYDAVLVDEAQDLTAVWIQGLTKLLNPATNSLLLCLDPAQNIFGRKISYRSMGVNVVGGGRTSTLEKSYRNTSEILDLARLFSPTGHKPTSAVDPEDSAERTLFPLSTERHGNLPILITEMSPADQIAFVLDEIEDFDEEGLCGLSDIAVLYTSYKWAEIFSQAFAQRFGPEKLFWVSKNSQTKDRFDITSPTVKLSTIQSGKGLEFRVVFLTGLEHLPDPKRDAESERKLAYVGLTRAQDLLYVLGNTRSGLLKELTDFAQTHAAQTHAQTHGSETTPPNPLH